MRPLLTALLLLLPALSFAAKPPGARDVLQTQCLLHAADPKNPWAMAHGITGLGRNFVAADGRKASEVIVSDFLQKNPTQQGSPYGFLRYAPDRTPIEPHTNLLVKTLVQAGVPDATKFKTSFGQQVTLGELVRSVELGYQHVPLHGAYWEDVGWTLDLLVARHSPKKATFKNRAGETIDLNKVMDDALAYLEMAHGSIAEGMDQGLPEVAKRKQGIYSHPCGGMHLIQAVNAWGRHPEVRKKWGKRLDRQIEVLFYRLGSEQRQYEAALNAAPQYRMQILVQMMKFYGHFLETTGRARKEGTLKPNAAQKRDIAKAQALLDWTVGELNGSGVWERMDELKKSQPQLHLDLIGDACHALHGLDYSKR